MASTLCSSCRMADGLDVYEGSSSDLVGESVTSSLASFYLWEILQALPWVKGC